MVWKAPLGEPPPITLDDKLGFCRHAVRGLDEAYIFLGFLKDEELQKEVMALMDKVEAKAEALEKEESA